MGDLAQAIANLEEKRVNELIDREIKEGVNPLDIIHECNEGMVRVGELFSEGKYFISELIYSADILKQVMVRLDPLLAGVQTGTATKGKVVIGTVQGDIHDIG
ncbi:MAG: B12-binding domain-containing protein [Desulfomonilaceae bacterium]